MHLTTLIYLNQHPEAKVKVRLIRANTYYVDFATIVLPDVAYKTHISNRYQWICISILLIVTVRYP